MEKGKEYGTDDDWEERSESCTYPSPICYKWQIDGGEEEKKTERTHDAVELTKQMKHVKMNSTAVESAAYDPVEKVLEVKFKSGKVYRYDDVPNNVYAGFMQAEFPGRFVNHTLRNYGGAVINESD